MQASFIGPPVLQTAFGIHIVDRIAPPEEVISTSFEFELERVIPKYARKKADTQSSSNHMRDVNAPLRHNSMPTLNCANEASERMTCKSRMHSHWNNEDNVYNGNSSQVDIQSLY
jgi:hypothetical protein